LDLIVELAHKLHIRVEPVPRKIKEVRDNKLLKMVLAAKEEGLADTQEVLNKLGIKA
jgi:hypothetical protein